MRVCWKHAFFPISKKKITLKLDHSFTIKPSKRTRLKKNHLRTRGKYICRCNKWAVSDIEKVVTEAGIEIVDTSGVGGRRSAVWALTSHRSCRGGCKTLREKNPKESFMYEVKCILVLMYYFEHNRSFKFEISAHFWPRWRQTH